MANNDKRSRVYGIAWAMVLIVASLLLFLTVASYDPHDRIWGYEVAAPANSSANNLCGALGALLSHGLRFLVGTGSYLVVALFAGIGAMLLLNLSLRDRVLRSIGVGLVLISWCALSEMLLSGWSFVADTPAGPGGMIGYSIAAALNALGKGKYLVVLLGLAVGALLAADAFVFWLGRKSAEMTMRHLPPVLGGPQPDPVTEEKSTRPEERIAEQKELLRKRIEERKAARAGKDDQTDVMKEPAPKPEPPPKPTVARPVPADAPTVIVPEPKRRPAPQAEKTAETVGFSKYEMPPLDLLDPPQKSSGTAPDDHIEEKREILERTLEEFGIAAQVVEVDRGPVITQFELELAPGVKIGKIVGLSDDIARALKAPAVRIVAPIPGKNTVGVEVPNANRETVRLRELFDSGVLRRKQMTIPVLLGKDASGEPLITDLAQMPHMLIAGTTGSGKSVCMNSIIMTFLMTQHPDEMKMILVDPKMVELSAFKDIPHLMSPVLTDMKKAASVLEWATHKMDERYSLLANVGARNIAAFNALGEKELRKRLDMGEDEYLEGITFFMPYIIIIIDELADLMMVAPKEVENTITRLAQKSRAVGIHLIVATQRPSVDVVTGLIKANIPSRVAFQTASKVDSRTILDRNGAEKLLGKGDMLFLPPGTAKVIRAQACFTGDDEIHRVLGWLHERARPRYDAELANPKGLALEEAGAQDEFFDAAVRLILESRRGSVSLLQRKLGIGYSRASRLVDLMADAGIVGEYKGSQAREVLMTLEEWDARQGNSKPVGPAPRSEDPDA